MCSACPPDALCGLYFVYKEEKMMEDWKLAVEFLYFPIKTSILWKFIYLIYLLILIYLFDSL